MLYDLSLAIVGASSQTKEEQGTASWPAAPVTAKNYLFPLRSTYLGCRDSKPAPIIRAGPSLLPKGHQLLHVLHLHQDLIPEKLHLLMVIEGAGSLGLLPPLLWLVFLSSVFLLCRWYRCRGTMTGRTTLSGAKSMFGDVETHSHQVGSIGPFQMVSLEHSEIVLCVLCKEPVKLFPRTRT